MAGVDIEWDHGDLEKSKQGAKEMIEGFGLAVPPASTNAPALLTHHTSGTAIDMDITWSGTIKIKKKDGKEDPAAYIANANSNVKLHAVGASYGVKKLTTDAPHWSYDGHQDWHKETLYFHSCRLLQSLKRASAAGCYAIFIQ